MVVIRVERRGGWRGEERRVERRGGWCGGSEGNGDDCSNADGVVVLMVIV